MGKSEDKTAHIFETPCRIATQLLGCDGVRLWHDQALYKEPSGGFTPWHADQQYWPMASNLAVTLGFLFTSSRSNKARSVLAEEVIVNGLGEICLSQILEAVIQNEIRNQGLLRLSNPMS